MKHEQSLRTVLFDLPSFFFYSSRRVLWRWKAQSRIFVSNEGRRGFHGFTNICTILHSFARVCVCVRGCLHGVNAGESCEHENKTSQKGALGNQVYSSMKFTTHKKKWNKNNVEVSAAKEHGFIFRWKKTFQWWRFAAKQRTILRFGWKPQSNEALCKREMKMHTGRTSCGHKSNLE